MTFLTLLYVQGHRPSLWQIVTLSLPFPIRLFDSTLCQHCIHIEAIPPSSDLIRNEHGPFL